MTALGKAPDPDAALTRFDTLVAGLPSAVHFFHLLAAQPALAEIATRILSLAPTLADALGARVELIDGLIDARAFDARSEEHTSELQSLMRISYAVFCLKKKKEYKTNTKY